MFFFVPHGDSVQIICDGQFGRGHVVHLSSHIFTVWILDGEENKQIAKSTSD